jgi:hypothetical protein
VLGCIVLGCGSRLSNLITFLPKHSGKKQLKVHRGIFIHGATIGMKTNVETGTIVYRIRQAKFMTTRMVYPVTAPGTRAVMYMNGVLTGMENSTLKPVQEKTRKGLKMVLCATKGEAAGVIAIHCHFSAREEVFVSRERSTISEDFES